MRSYTLALQFSNPVCSATGNVLGLCRNHAPDGNVRLYLLTLVVTQRRFERSQRHLIDAHGTHERVFSDTSQHLRFTYQYSSLWPTKQFVARKAHHICTRCDALLGHWLMCESVVLTGNQTSAAKIVHHQQTALMR